MTKTARRRDGKTARRRLALAVFLAVLPPCRLSAQCPDGTPPPCRTASAARPSATVSPTSVAVFPFENRSPDTTDAYLAVGMTEEIGNRLTQVGRLQIKSRGLVKLQWQRTPEPIAAARALGVAWFVHGNLRHTAGQLVVNVELVRANGEEAWASRFPRRDADVFAVQAEIAESVAVVVGGRLSPGERTTLTRRPTTNNEAYRLYLFGNSLVNRRTREDLREAVRAYQQALALDPAFAAAWARLSLAINIQASWGWEPRTGDSGSIARGMAASRRALALDSSSAEAWLALANSQQDYDGNLAAARDAYERSLRLDSMNAETYHHYASGLYTSDCPAHCMDLPAQAIPLFRRALRMDPTLRNTWRHLAAVERDSGLYERARAHLDTALSFGPWPPANADRALINYLLGQYDSALTDEILGRDTPQARWYVAWLVAAARGDSARLKQELADVRADTSRDQRRYLLIATYATALGQRDVALSALEAARALPEEPPATRCSATALCSANLDLWRALQTQELRPLRSEPRFQRLWNETRPRVPWLQ